MSNDTFNTLRKKSQTKQSLRTPLQWICSESCCGGVGWAIWHITSPSLQISTGNSTDQTPCSYRRINHTDDDQNPQGYCHKASNLRTRQQYDDWRNCKLCCLSSPCQRRLSWLIVPGKITNFAWSTFKHIFLIFLWKFSLKKSQFSLLTIDIKSNIFMSNDTFNILRKKSKTKQSLRTPFQWIYSEWCCRGAGWTIWHLTLPNLQISEGRSTDQTSCTYFKINHTDDDQNRSCVARVPEKHGQRNAND